MTLGDGLYLFFGEGGTQFCNIVGAERQPDQMAVVFFETVDDIIGIHDDQQR